MLYGLGNPFMQDRKHDMPFLLDAFSCDGERMDGLNVLKISSKILYNASFGLSKNFIVN